MRHVGSSNLLKIDYNKRTRVLQIIFVNRPTWLYSYSNVEYRTWTKLLKAESKGEFFYNFIRDVYQYRKTINRKT